MAARPRQRVNRHLPDQLYFDKSTGVYRFTLVTGKRKSLGTDRAIAIAVAREYNNQMRPEKTVSIHSLIRESGGNNGEARPFSEHVDKILARAIIDEKPAAATRADWESDKVRVKEYFSNIATCDIDLEHVNGFIQHYHADASANVQNRKASFLKKLFSYAVDESLMMDNPAARKKMRRTDSKIRRRLSIEDFIKIRNAADRWLRTAMDLAIQTAQARLEVSRIRYNISQPKEGVCGCKMYDEPVNGIHGMLYIHRQKVQHKEASHVAIPIGNALKAIIDESRDNIASPYVVHRLPLNRSNPTSKEVRHPTQVAPDYLSRAFSTLRDQVGVGSKLPFEQRPTFHEIRALAAHMFKIQGMDPQARMAHSDAKSTQIYTENHVAWVEVPHGEIAV
ncbi:phage integrase Arm DNA-binding domain-containing protein [Yersinia enterocolitica]|uniref:phage integrase Arm DNA-binding domain-containing protein n=1 Tax=Yersinia enterocolitica TaxID=630 RepID=UPI000977A336|nr:phage integrase Arm DNA-binding domain-containing protein [Yersinia enterocolitica]EKN3386188.1 phage integrase Arm DNA-binding domain-containing protein [Yersinia enterocolitica]EKN3766717.1 phage integrase Arm DNA-binding domain-containing protein [Yersinia enterocolitica]EKN4081656.1 phage integrase Arm DNA-binding domain-containing protein [Yersinia enterocolitica]EKN6167617.1 recombinase [Yersinia enterocolitica]EKN6395102.1 recombinase [Yersinia enterocolitica]